MDIPSFVSLIVEDPFDEDLRMVFADFLEEREDSRSELIRIQLSRGDTPDWEPARLEVVELERDAQRRAGYRFFGKLPEGVTPMCSEGGFYSGVNLSVTSFLKHRKTLFRQAPITTLRLEGRAQDLSRVAQAAELHQIQKLTFAVNTAEEEISRFFESPHLTGIKSLKLETERLDRGVFESVLQSVFARQLQVLEVNSWYQFSGSGIERMAQSDHLQLQALDVGAGLVNADELSILAIAPAFRSLRSLKIRGDFSDGAFAAFQEQAYCRDLVRLQVSSSQFSVTAFELERAFANLKWLQAGCRDQATLEKMLQHYPNLEVLELPNGSLEDPAAELLTAPPISQQIRRLNLEGNQLTLEGAETLGAAFSDSAEVLLNDNVLDQSDVVSLQNRFGSSFGRFSPLRHSRRRNSRRGAN